jgi:hypothetical protein
MSPHERPALCFRHFPSSSIAAAWTHPRHSSPSPSPTSVHPLGARASQVAILRPSLSRSLRSRWRLTRMRPPRLSAHQPSAISITPGCRQTRTGRALAHPSEPRSLTHGAVVVMGLVRLLPVRHPIGGFGASQFLRTLVLGWGMVYAVATGDWRRRRLRQCASQPSRRADEWGQP